MSKMTDRFDNPINAGDVIAYSGYTVGLIVGVVVKINNKSFKVKTKSVQQQNGRVSEQYYNVPFTQKNHIVTAVGMNTVDPMYVLNDVEKLRLGITS